MNHTQRGSVLYYILIAVVLFAALGFAVSNMMRAGSGGNIGAEKDALTADQVLSYARSVRQGAQTLRISNGCAENQISFERSPFDGSDPLYMNAAAPSDFSCHIFHPNGAGVGTPEDVDGKAWRFTSEFYVGGVGSGAQAISMAIIVGRAVCLAVNRKLDIAQDAIDNPVDDGAGAGNVLPAFNGSFSGSGEILLPAYEGKMAGCYRSVNAGDDEYTVYQILVAR